MVRHACGQLGRFRDDERAQNTFEFLLVAGVVVVLMVGVMIVGFQLLLPGVLGHMCPAVDSGFPTAVPPATTGSCLGP